MTSGKMSNELFSVQQFLDNYFIVPLRLNCDNEVGHINGFDSRNTNSIMEFNTTGGLSASTDSYILVETTSTLKIGPGKAIEIVL